MRLAFWIFFIALVFSAGNYYARTREYKQYRLEKKPDVVSTYKFNINLANDREFENLPGLGPKLAKEIIEYRNKNGRFDKIEDLKKIPGIGEKKFEQIKPYLTLEVI